MALDFVTLVDESIVDGNDMRCLLALVDELRLLVSGIVVAVDNDKALWFSRSHFLFDAIVSETRKCRWCFECNVY